MDGEAYALLLRRLAALERRVSALFRSGRVAEVQPAPYRVRVDIGPDGDGAAVLTDFLPVFVPRAGEVGDWTPLTAGERVAVLSPGGEDASAFVLSGLHSADYPAVNDDVREELRRFAAAGDAGTEVARIQVTRGATAAGSAMLLRCGAAAIHLGGSGGVAITSTSLTHNGTNVGDDHTHGGVASGPSRTSGPG